MRSKGDLYPLGKKTPAKTTPKARPRRAPVRVPMRSLPWRRPFTRFCNTPLPEDRDILLQLDAQLHKALRLIGADPVKED